MSISKRIFMIATVLVSCVSCDQGTKSMAQKFLPLNSGWSFLGDAFRLQLAHNHGAFLGLGANLPDTWRMVLLSVGVGLILLLPLGYALFAKSASKLDIIAMALVFAGGASNLLDRLMYDGYVVDFLNIGLGSLRTGIFNIADIAISLGTLMLLTPKPIKFFTLKNQS